jgi:hypothetical protein
MLTVETEVNGDSRITNERGPSLVGFLGLSCRFKRFLFFLGCSSEPSTKYFFLTIYYFNYFVPITQQVGQAAVLGRLSLSMCAALLRAGFFHRTPAGYTAERKTRRKRNMGCYELLSVSCHPSPPPLLLPLPTPRICRTACGHVIRIS